MLETSNQESLKNLIEYNYFNSQESQIYIKFNNYRPNIKLNFTNSKYQLKTADSVEELLSCFRLRYKSFLAEQGNLIQYYDYDEFDFGYDHMIIKDLSTDKVIGTYRLANSLHHQTFYSSNEFDISELLAKDGVKLELGRACIEKEFRTGSVLDMLWKGIAAYTKAIDAKYLFGCTSLHTEDSQQVSKMYHYLLEQGHIENNLNVSTQEKYKMQLTRVHDIQMAEIQDIYPSLLKSYIKAGAKLLATPAHDKEFQCVDFLTLFKPEEASDFFKKRYFN